MAIYFSLLKIEIIFYLTLDMTFQSLKMLDNF